MHVPQVGVATCSRRVSPNRLLLRSPLNHLLALRQASIRCGRLRRDGHTMADNSNSGMAGKVWQAKKGKATLDTPCGDKHEWKQMSEYVKHCKKFRCERDGCGFFKKCWTACEDINCKGCHVIGHKRW